MPHLVVQSAFALTGRLVINMVICKLRCLWLGFDLINCLVEGRTMLVSNIDATKRRRQ